MPPVGSGQPRLARNLNGPARSGVAHQTCPQLVHGQGREPRMPTLAQGTDEVLASHERGDGERIELPTDWPWAPGWQDLFDAAQAPRTVTA